ncbi:PDZ and LIM domain protein Zasp isoform X3 [Drosophila elegans]|uniref:PDZ and LIM domain protein Zasp isoform X3 n=1 Tax=Drosophila elegans TaxID=30023 RepID=UPI001BC82E33|nr:PDZ and LIM domain protein Zasp isoform X3 [Drosophila elegans]
MAQPQLLQVKLSRFDAQPWGFRLQGGTDFAQPLLVQKVNAGSLSEQAGLQPGDAVVKINDVDVFNLRHKDAQDIVVRSGNNFVITVQRGGSTWRPHVTPTGNVPQPNSPYLQTVTKTSLAHKQQDSQHIGCGYNNAARPFSNGGDGGVKSIVNKQYNTPVGIYSDESIAETLSAQAEVLAGGVLGVNFKKNEKEYQGDRSEVLKFLREEETGQSTPAFGNSHYEHDAPQQQQQPQQQQYNQQQHQQQHYHQQHHQQQQQQQLSSTTRHVSAPVNSPKPPSTGGLPTGQNICTECERLITGVFVRIKDKNLHVECFKCATCGTSLKNQGYYNFNNKLYCDIHAKQAAINNPPSGTEGYVPVPIKPNTKLSASTISTALNSHGYGGSNSNGYSNGNSAPAPVASPQATALQAATPIVATATDSPAATATSDNMSAYVADEPSSIYGQINTNSGAVAPPPQQQQQQPTAGGGDQPFEYVTLTGNVIRSVQAPGKGTGTSYKVNQGYARPFGAAAPKSPVASYPPQQQQQSPRPAPGGNNNFNNNNAYATLPRSNVGQQVPTGVATAAKVTNPHANPQTYATLPRPHPQATDLAAHEMDKEPHQESDATSLLAESVGKIDMGDKTHAFMQEAGKIINNMLEARLANNGGPSAPLSHAGSSLSLRSNSSSNLSKSPMIVRKRLDLDDFKNLDPTQPVALQPVVAVHSQKDLPAEVGNQRAQPQVPRVEQTLQMELPAQHPMGKILDLCDGGKAIDAPEPVAFRNNLRRTGATHAADRRSYIEPKQGPSVAASQNANQNADQNGNGTQNSSPTYSVSVKALGPHSEDQKTMSEENERAVSQLLKEGKRPVCCQCNKEITSGPFITALGRIWCPDHFICVNGNCRRPLQDIGFVEEKGDLYCEYCFEKYLAPTCSKCAGKIKGDCLNAIGKHFHPECFTCGQCGKIFGNRPFFLEDGNAYCEADWNELFTTKCFACGFPVEAGDRWVEALNHNYHSQCFNCTFCKQNLEGQSFYNKGGRPFCKNHAR